MKFIVTYYDIDSDKTVTKDCYRLEFSNGEFHFYPVDDPVKIYKAITIDHPKVTIYQKEDKLSIRVEGFQCMKNGGYWRTYTNIVNVEKD